MPDMTQAERATQVGRSTVDLSGFQTLNVTAGTSTPIAIYRIAARAGIAFLGQPAIIAAVPHGMP